MKQQRGLGKGLGALIGEPEMVEYESAELQNGDRLMEIDVALIDPNPAQARKVFERDALEQLADSIRIHGVIQPVLVIRTGGRYRLIAGERRWRACMMLKLEKIPAILTDKEDRQLAEVSLIENLQRENLNPIEEAMGIRYIMEEFSLTQEKVAERLGKSRSAVANALRLLNLTDEVRQLVWDGKLSAGHARALVVLSEEQQANTAAQIVEQDMTVRGVEAMVQATLRPQGKREAMEREQRIAPELFEFQRQLQEAVGTRVRVKGTLEKGMIQIDYYEREDLERILEALN